MSNKDLKSKTELAFSSYLGEEMRKLRTISGHDTDDLGGEKEGETRDLLVWARDVRPHEDMPAETGCMIVTLIVQVVYGATVSKVERDDAISDVICLMDPELVRQRLNQPPSDPDPRKVLGYHVYDVTPVSQVDDRDEDHIFEQPEFEILCGEHNTR